MVINMPDKLKGILDCDGTFHTRDDLLCLNEEILYLGTVYEVPLELTCSYLEVQKCSVPCGFGPGPFNAYDTLCGDSRSTDDGLGCGGFDWTSKVILTENIVPYVYNNTLLPLDCGMGVGNYNVIDQSDTLSSRFRTCYDEYAFDSKYNIYGSPIKSASSDKCGIDNIKNSCKKHDDYNCEGYLYLAQSSKLKYKSDMCDYDFEFIEESYILNYEVIRLPTRHIEQHPNIPAKICENDPGFVISTDHFVLLQDCDPEEKCPDVFIITNPETNELEKLTTLQFCAQTKVDNIELLKQFKEVELIDSIQRKQRLTAETTVDGDCCEPCIQESVYFDKLKECQFKLGEYGYGGIPLAPTCNDNCDTDMNPDACGKKYSTIKHTPFHNDCCFVFSGNSSPSFPSFSPRFCPESDPKLQSNEEIIDTLCCIDVEEEYPELKVDDCKDVKNNDEKLPHGDCNNKIVRNRCNIIQKHSDHDFIIRNYNMLLYKHSCISNSSICFERDDNIISDDEGVLLPPIELHLGAKYTPLQIKGIHEVTVKLMFCKKTYKPCKAEPQQPEEGA